MLKGKIDVLCVGHASYDIIIPMQFYPTENSKTEIDTTFGSGGGPAANAAFMLSKWGVRSAFAGSIGDDNYGCCIMNEFATAEMDTSLLEVRKNHSTPLSIILVNTSNGSRTIINRKSPVLDYTLPDAEFRPQLLLFDGHELNASLAALRAFPGVITILDAGSVRPGTMRLVHEVDYVVASERFALQFCGIDKIDTVDKQRQCLEQIRSKNNPVVITLGERGLIYDDGSFHQLRALNINAIDTTAAGDIFHGAFAYGLLKRFSFKETLKLASIAAGISVTRLGGRSSIPDLEEVLNTLKSSELV